MDHAVPHGQALERSARRFARLLRSGLDRTQPVKGLRWTIGELGAHVATGAMSHREIIEVGASPYLDLDERADTNQARLAEEAETDLAVLADRIEADVARVVAGLATRSDPDAPMPWHGGVELAPPAFVGAMVGELVFHGWDLASTVGDPWPIDRRDAIPMVDFFVAVTPHVVDRRKVAALDATVEVRFRGYTTATFRFDHGTLTVTDQPADRADVRLSVEPVAFLQIGYKRIGLARPLLTGQALAWGRKPWLGLRFPGLFQAP